MASRAKTEPVNNGDQAYETLMKLAKSKAIVVFSMSGCCMCVTVKHLLHALGASPTVIELDDHSLGPEMQAVLYHIAGKQVKDEPSIFIGGEFFGGVETLMTCHIKGTLIPLLKNVGAIWL